MVESQSEPFLSPGAEDLFRRLLPPWGPSAVPNLESKAAEVTELLALGLVHRSSTAPSGLAPVDPGAVAMAWSKRNTAAAEGLINDAIPLLMTLQRLVQEQRQSARERRELVYLQGAESIERAITESLHLVEHEILACLPQGPPGTAASQVATGVRATLARGIPVRTIYPNVARQQEPLRRHIEAVSRGGAQVRTVPWLFAQALIIDRRIAFLPEPATVHASSRSLPPSAKECHLLISSPNVVAHFVDHFEMLWAMGQRWDPASASGDPAPIALDDEELAILGFLDQGLTMDAIANRQGISERTLSNRLGQLKGKFNVASLYALGSRWQALQDSQSVPGPRASAGAEND